MFQNGGPRIRLLALYLHQIRRNCLAVNKAILAPAQPLHFDVSCVSVDVFKLNMPKDSSLC